MFSEWPELLPAVQGARQAPTQDRMATNSHTRTHSGWGIVDTPVHLTCRPGDNVQTPHRVAPAGNTYFSSVLQLSGTEELLTDNCNEIHFRSALVPRKFCL